MSFLNPWAVVLGIVAVGLPVLIHWLTRPRPTLLPLSTLRFVREVVRERRAHNRLRDWLILGSRTLAVLFLAWAVARPLIGHQSLVEPQHGAPAARIILLDVSQSMAAEAGGVQLFEKARAIAAGYLADQPGLRVNLVFMAAAPRAVFDQLSTNGAALRQELDGAAVRPQRLNASTALNLAGEFLAKGARPGERREVVVISDLQRSNWAGADFSALPDDTLIQVESVAPAAPLANVAIIRAGPVGRVEVGRDIRLEVEIGNYTPGAKMVNVEVAAEQALYRLSGLCAPHTTTVLSAEVPMRGSGWQTAEARLLDSQDALPADDRRAFVLFSRAAPVYVLVTRQPAEALPSSSYFLERALAPSSGSSRPEARVTRVAPGQLEEAALAEVGVLVLDHPGKLDSPALKTLAGMVRRGRGLLYCIAEGDDAVNLRAFAEILGSDWQPPVEYLPPALGQRRKDLFLVDVKRSQPPFAIFGDEWNSMMSELRFAGGLATRRLERGLADDILATFNDQSAALVVTPCGSGVIALLNAELGSSNLPVSPAFLPLMNELAARLAIGQQQATSFVCGESASFQIPASAGPLAGLRAIGPDGKESGELVHEAAGVVWRIRTDAPPGIHRVLRDKDVAYAAAALIPADEADLRPIDAEVLRERLAGGRRVHVRTYSGDDTGVDWLWSWLAVACLSCLIGEVALLRLFRV